MHNLLWLTNVHITPTLPDILLVKIIVEFHLGGAVHSAVGYLAFFCDLACVLFRTAQQ